MTQTNEELMRSLVNGIANKAKNSRVVMDEKRKEMAAESAAIKTADKHGEIIIDGKSLGRFTAATEERDGEAHMGKNPENVVIGKREDWVPNR